MEIAVAPHAGADGFPYPCEEIVQICPDQASPCAVLRQIVTLPHAEGAPRPENPPQIPAGGDGDLKTGQQDFPRLLFAEFAAQFEERPEPCRICRVRPEIRDRITREKLGKAAKRSPGYGNPQRDDIARNSVKSGFSRVRIMAASVSSLGRLA